MSINSSDETQDDINQKISRLPKLGYSSKEYDHISYN